MPGGITEIWKNGIRVLVERPDGSVEVGGGSKGIMIGPDMLVARPVVPSRAPATPPVTAPKGPAASVPLPPTAAPEPAKAKTLLAGLPPTMQTMMKNAPGYNGSIAAYREKGSLTVSVALPDPEKSPEEFIHVLMELTALPTEWVEPLGAMALMHYRDPKIMPLPLTEDRALALVDAIVGKRVQMYNVRLTDADLKDVNSPLARVSKGELGIKVADALEDNIEKLIAYDSIVLEPLLGEAKLVADQLKSEKLGDRVSKLKLDTVEQRIRAGRLLGEVRSVRREVAARKPPAATPATSVAGAGALAPAVAPREAERPAPKQQAWIEAFEMPKDASPLNKEAWSSHLRKTEARVIIRYMVNSGQIGTREADLLIRYSNPEEDKRPRYLEVTAPLKRYLVAANSLIAANEALPDMTPYGAIEMPADLLSAGGGPPPALTETRSGKALLGDTRGELGPERPTVSLEDFARTGQLTPQTPPLLPPPIPQPAAPTQATAPKAPEARPLPVIPAAPPAPPVPLPAAATQEPTVSLVMDAPVKIIDASKSIALAPLPDILTREITTDYKAQHGFLEPGDALQLSAWLAAANTLTERDYMREFPIWLIERCNIDTAVGDDKFRATAEAGSIGELAKRSTRLTKFEDVMRLRALVRAAVKAGVIRIEQPVPPAREVGIDARLLAKVPLSLDYDGSDALRRWYNNNDNKEKLNRLGRDYRHLDDASKVLYEFVKTPWVMVSGRTAPTPILADEKVMRAFLSLAKTALEASGVLDFDETKELRETLGVLSRHGAPKSASAVTIEEGMVAVNEEQIAPPTGLVPAQRYYSEPEPKSKGPGLLARAKSWGSGLLGRKKKPAEEKPAESTPAKEYDEDVFTSEDNEGPSEENEGGGRMDGRGVMPLFPGVADDDLRLFGIRRKPPAVTVELRNR